MAYEISGQGSTAAKPLVDFANHASPLLAWRVEQPPQGRPYRQVGDMPHNWTRAKFIRLAIHLIAMDRGQELHQDAECRAGVNRPAR